MNEVSVSFLPCRTKQDPIAKLAVPAQGWRCQQRAHL